MSLTITLDDILSKENIKYNVNYSWAVTIPRPTSGGYMLLFCYHKWMALLLSRCHHYGTVSGVDNHRIPSWVASWMVGTLSLKKNHIRLGVTVLSSKG